MLMKKGAFSLNLSEIIKVYIDSDGISKHRLAPYNTHCLT